ncbi:MAG: hypothetical protein HOK21_19065 [Rhodospirillaceae bacterium]|nr:hypothetical protein [Rhodospirillaceae bacterium]MBT4044516.1 hypothetical protein [Rhodospirillaceae bacterium]MBT5079098.1 hypothetical protein [Rhodospirillaceae bacterium]MBT5526191.1 hypothetical protein [Rhodospirillaceae bacterium]MBT6984191.1 hypothetical protein [Rhodospirillaceae bacterium]
MAQLLSVSKMAPVFAVISLITGMLIVAVMWDYARVEFLLPWAILATIPPCLNFLAWRRNRHRTRPENINPKVITRITRGTIILGLVWGIGVAWIYPANALLPQMFLAAILAGLGAGTAAGMAAIPRAANGYSLALVLPFLARLLIEGSGTHLVMFLMAAVFLVFLLVLSRTVHDIFIDAIHTKVANDRLVRDLGSMQNNLLDAIESTSEGFAIFDEEDRLLYYNNTYLNMFGTWKDKIVPGISFAEITRIISTPLQCEGCDLQGDAFREWRLRHHLEGAGSFQQQHTNGTWTLTTDRHTRQGGYVNVHVDITDMKQHEGELATARDEALSASRAKSEFLALMSHELRTPLNSILGFSDILKDQSFGNHSDPRYLEYAGNIHDSGSHLLRIITDILDLSKIEAGKFELTEEEFELEIPFNNVQAMMARLAEDAGLTLSLECDPDLPGLRGDLRTVQQMLINLVSNSVKFTPSGGSITVTAERQDDTSGGGLVIQIADTGVGIAPENIAKVLSPFGQIEGPMRRQHQGTGLGLPLVRSFMHLHDGELSIDSNAPQGTTIDLTFPKDRLVERVAVATKKELKAEKSA